MISQKNTPSQDTGSSAVQIRAQTAHIKNLSRHLDENPKDFHCRLGLMRAISLRRRLLRYLARTQNATYKDLLVELSLRH